MSTRRDTYIEPQDYGYSARDAKGRRRTGVLSAASHVQATRQLRDQGLYPIEINAIEAGAAAQGAKRQFSFKRAATGRMSARQRAEFLGRLAKLAGARISIDRALRIMAEGETGNIAKAAQDLRVHIREGGGFADGLKAATGIDDAATLALVRGAETSGELDVALATAAGILEQRLAVTRRVITGLLYPSLLLIVSIISVGVIMIAIIPQFRPLVEDRMEFVPFLGRLVFAFSGILSALWPLILLGLITLTAGSIWLHRKGKATAIAAQIINRVPMVRDLIERNHAMMALHILGALLKRDVTLSEALRVVAQTAPAGRVRGAIQRVSRAVAEGATLAESFSKTRIFAPSAVEMLRIGEETGALGDM
ncbi:MAG: type II secretion system F family protein, partial [Pseudomonadota bacterium]